MKKFEELEMQFNAMLKNETLNDYHKTNGLEFIVFEIIKLIDEDEITDEELMRCVQINMAHADYLYNLNIKILEQKIKTMDVLRTKQDNILEILNNSKDEIVKNEAIEHLKKIHSISNGDIDEEINKIKKIIWFLFLSTK